MPKRRPTPTAADARPRVYLRAGRDGWRWGTHPTSVCMPACATAGRALEAALAYVGVAKGVVVFVEGAE